MYFYVLEEHQLPELVDIKIVNWGFFLFIQVDFKPT